MTRRKKTSPAEDLMDLVAMLPWWAGIGLAVVSYLLLHGVASQSVVAATQPGQMGTMLTQTLWKTFASVGQYVLPIICLAGAGMSAWRRRERKQLVVDVAQSKASDALDGMSWREFEMLVGEGFRLQGYQVVETGGGLPMVESISCSRDRARTAARNSSCSASSGAPSRWAWTWSVTFVGDSAETSKTYLLTAKYALTPTSNVYARVASGYRPGGPNPALRDANGNALVPPTFQHDSLWSYEAGYKADLLEKSLSIQAAVYDIRWSQIQQYFAVNGVNVIVNGGRAHIQGAELSATYRPTSQLSIGGGLSYTGARLSEDAPGLALAGSRLPNTPRFSANFSANYGFELGGRAAHVGISQRLVSSRNAGFDGSAALPQYRLPGYGLTDLQAGVDLERFQIALFVRNLFDRRAQIGGETNLVAAGVGGPVMVNEARPFTIGTTLTAKF